LPCLYPQERQRNYCSVSEQYKCIIFQVGFDGNLNF